MKKTYLKNSSPLSSSSLRGSTLIETMIALFVLAIGVLGVMSMQVNSVKHNKSASLYLQASFLANDIYEGILLTPDSVDSYALKYDATTPSKPSCGKGENCAASDVIALNQHNWRSNIASMLPAGQGEIREDDDGKFIIAIRFELGADNDGKAEVIEYTLAADI